MQVPSRTSSTARAKSVRSRIGVLALAASGQMKATLQTETDTARALGFFGAPTFATGEELFGATID